MVLTIKSQCTRLGGEEGRWTDKLLNWLQSPSSANIKCFHHISYCAMWTMIPVSGSQRRKRPITVQCVSRYAEDFQIKSQLTGPSQFSKTSWLHLPFLPYFPLLVPSYSLVQQIELSVSVLRITLFAYVVLSPPYVGNPISPCLTYNYNYSSRPKPNTSTEYYFIGLFSQYKTMY